MPDHEPMINGVRVTNADIYKLLTDVDRRMLGVEQTIKQVVEPSLARHDEALKHKADRELVIEIRGRTATLEMRTYAIIGGLVAALFGAKGLGLL